MNNFLYNYTNNINIDYIFLALNFNIIFTAFIKEILIFIQSQK